MTRWDTSTPKEADHQAQIIEFAVVAFGATNAIAKIDWYLEGGEA
jgi:hypothetical protein